MTAVRFGASGIQGDRHPETRHIIPVLTLWIAADGACRRVTGAALYFIAAIGHLYCFRAFGCQQDRFTDISAANVVEVIGEQFPQSDLIRQHYPVGDAEFDPAAKRYGQLGQGIGLAVWILRQSLPFRTQRVSYA